MNIFHVVFFIINYYYLYRKPLRNKVIMPIFLGNSNISYKENKNSITPYNALLFKNQRVGIGVNINSILNNSLEVNGDINILSSSTYKINNANIGYSNLDHKLLAGTNISIGADFKVNNTYTLPSASSSVIGCVRVGNNLSILDGVLSAPSPYTLPTSSSSVLGGIRVGNNLSIDANSILSVPSYTLPTASASVIGGIRVGNNLSILDGALSAPPPYTLPTASGAVIGGIRVGNNLSIDANSVLSAPPYTPYTLPTASSSVIGGVRVGANLTIDASGILSAPPPYTLPTASGAVLGAIKVGNNLSIDANSVLSAPPYTPYTLPTASSSVIGGVRVGANLTIDASGILSAPPPYTLPTASSSVIGGVRVGNNLSITDGVLSAPSPYTLPTASTSVLGGIRVDGTTIAINADVISYTGGIPQWSKSENNIYNTNTLNVGIGTSNPQSKLHIIEENNTSDSSTRTLIIQSTNNSIIELIRGTSSDANIDFKIGNYTSTVHNDYGDFIVKSSINGSDSDYIKIIPGGNIYNFNNSLYWTQTSDRRIKENIEIASYDKCYENIDRLELKRFNYIKEFKTGNKDTNQLGFIAQEIKDIFPKSVFTNSYNSDELNIPDMLSIDIGQINYTLFGAVKKLMEINYDEEMRLKRLEDFLNIEPNTSNIEVTESLN